MQMRSHENDEINSTNGYVFTLAGGAMSWKSTKQSCTTNSTRTFEFVAFESAGKEAEWQRESLADMPLWGSQLHQFPCIVTIKPPLQWQRIASIMRKGDTFI